MPARVKGVLEARWGKGVGALQYDTWTFILLLLHLCISQGLLAKSESSEDNLQLSALKQRKGSRIDAHGGRGDIMGSNMLSADFQQIPPHWALLSPPFWNFHCFINPKPLRVPSGWSSSVPTCLQAIGFLLSSFCQGNYCFSIHFSPSKNLLKAFITNRLSSSLTLLINLFFKFLGYHFNKIWVERKDSCGQFHYF